MEVYSESTKKKKYLNKSQKNSYYIDLFSVSQKTIEYSKIVLIISYYKFFLWHRSKKY